MKKSLLLLSALSLWGATPLSAQTSPTNPYTLARIQMGTETFTGVAISPNGKVAAVAQMEEYPRLRCEVRLFGTASKRALPKITSHQAPINTLLFSPDGKYLLSQDQDGGALLSSLSLTRSPKWLIKAQKGAGYNGTRTTDSFMTWSPNSRWLVSGPYGVGVSSPQQWKLWDVKTGRARVLAPANDWGGNVAFDRNGNVVIAGIKSKHIQVKRFNINNGRQVSQQEFGDSGTVQLSPDSRFLLISRTSGTGKYIPPEKRISTHELWDVSMHQKLATLGGGMEHPTFSGDGQTLVTTDLNGRIFLRSLTDGHYGSVRRTLPAFSGGELDVVGVSHDGNWLVSLDTNSPARLWNLSAAFSPLRYPLRTMLMGYNGQQVQAVGDGFRTVGVMGSLPSTRLEVQEQRGSALKRWQVPLGDDHVGLEPLELSRAGKFLVALWRQENTIELYDLDRRVQLFSWRAPAQIVSASFAPDAARLAVASIDGDISIMNRMGHPLLHWNASPNYLEQVTWSPSNTQIATLSEGTLTLWDTATGQKEREFTEFVARGAFAWSSDERTLIVGAGSKSEKYKVDRLLLVDAHRGQILRVIKLPSPQGLQRLKFSPDGSYIGVSYGLFLHLIRVADGKEIAAPDDDCPVFNFTWTSRHELAIDTGQRLKVWRVASLSQ